MRRTFLALASVGVLALTGLAQVGMSQPSLAHSSMAQPGQVSSASGHVAIAQLGAARRGAAVSQTYPMPGEGQVTIVGHGYGHGHGMSQYGAEGAARQGLNWQQITAFYYPGTKLTDASGYVSVLISADTSRDVVVERRSGLRVRNDRTRKGWTIPDRGNGKWRLVAGVGKRTRVEFWEGRWRWWKTFRRGASFYAGGKPIRLHYGSTSRLYRGRLVAALPAGGGNDRDTVNVLSIDNYIKGVIPAEMPATWSPAAVQAQSVAARTYASYEKAHPRAGHYQICDTTSCQVYAGYSGEHPAANAAVKATKGMILTHRGEPAFTQFGSSSGGWTSANQFSYLPAQADPYDGWSGNANHQWRTTVDVSRIERTWPAVGNLKKIRVTRRDGNGQWKGRIESMLLVGGKGKVTVSGDDFRSRLGLKSTWLTFR